MNTLRASKKEIVSKFRKLGYNIELSKWDDIPLKIKEFFTN
jgi:hypothetical protein